MTKFLTFDDRLDVEAGLKENKTFKEIAAVLGKDRSTISKEVKNRSVSMKTGYGQFPYNVCKKRRSCKRRKVCGNECSCISNQACKKCSMLCNRYCEDFEEVVCKSRFKAPYACNGCGEVRTCTLEKTIYDARDAHRAAMDHISQSRSGIFSTEEELLRMNDLLLPLIKQGQSIHQIYLSNREDLMCSERTLYRYIDSGLFDIKNIDLPRKVRYRQRYKKPEFKVDKGCRIGRNYHDYEEYIKAHPGVPVTQMDTVIGRRGGKVLLTVFFVNCSILLCFLRERNTSKSVTDIFDDLYEKLGHKDSCRLFQVILTDNGCEFSNPQKVEYASCTEEIKGLRRSRIFYCNPSAPYQKAEIEVAHEFIRRIVEKGKSFDELEQKDVEKMTNHINSYKRASLNGKSPYEAFCFYYGKELAQKLGIEEIPPNQIILKPVLLKK